jgi:hypothetical protein
MAHFAVLDENNTVTAVNVIADADCLDGETESEAVGIAFCESLWGAGTYKQTSYNNKIRKQFAEVGGTYDPVRNEFIKIKPYASWTLNATNDWTAPINKPDDGKIYEWNESAYQADNTNGWDEIIVPT